MSRQPKHFYEFGTFRVDAAERRLLRDGEPIQLPPKAFDTLLALVQNSGHLLTKDELLKAVWPDTFVEENNLTQYVSLLRRTLSYDGNGSRYIETVPRLGYRFAPGVREIRDDETDLIVETRTKVRLLIKEETREEVCEEASEDAPEAEEGRAIETRSSAAALALPAVKRRWGLKHIVVAVLSLAALALALLWTANRARRTENAPAPPVAFRAIAVLPFQLIGGSEADEYLGLGFADTLITRLSSVRQISVRPTSAVWRYTGARDALGAGREMDVDVVLDGRIQRSGGRIRVTAQLISVRDGASLWAGQFDENLNAIFSVQDALSAQVARALHLSLSAEQTARLHERGTDNPEAYQAYMRGRFFWNKRTGDGFARAIEHFQEAIRLDSRYAQAHAGLADCYSFLQMKGRAKEAAQRALELDETLAEPHASLANLYFFTEWNWPEAEREFRRAVELNPSYATAYHWYAFYLAAMGRVDESIAAIERAQELDPLSLIINTDAGQIYYYARQYDRAVAQLRRTVEMDPGFVMARYRLGEAYAQQGMYEEAIAEIRRGMELQGNASNGGPLGYAYAAAGRRAEAISAIGEWRGRFARAPRQSPGDPYWIATVSAVLGDREQAFHWLEKAYEQRHADLVLLLAEPRFDDLRADPRFADLLRRIKLAH